MTGELSARLARVAVPLVAIVGVVCSLLFWGTVRSTVNGRVDERLAGQAEVATARLQTELDRHVDALRAARGLFDATDRLTPDAWAAFVASLRLDQRLPAANGVAHIASVPEAEVETFEARQRADGLQDYTVAPRSTDENGMLRPIALIEPREGNEAALGFNLLGNPVLRPAIDGARDTGETRMTAPTRLVQETAAQTGFVVYTPLYDELPPQATAADRRASSLGWMATPFRGDDFLQAVFDDSGLDLDVTVVDVEAASVGAPAIGRWRAGDTASEHGVVTRRVPALGRTWELRAAPTVGLIERDLAPWIALLSGLAVTALSVALLRAQRSSERRAQRLADEATAQLVASQQGLAAANELLARRNRQLDSSNQELGRFAYVASHDLQEPLRMVTSFLGLLEEHLGGQLDDEGRQYLGFAVDGADRMAELIRDLLALSRVQHGERTHETVDVARLVEETLHILRDPVQHADACVEVVRADPVEADPRQLAQLLQNLIGNALKFRRADRTPRIEIEASRSELGWRLELRDNGVGVPAEYREQVFGTFRRLHSRDEYEGTGIGLAICARIVEGHGGSITVEDGIDGGASFVIWLPQQSAATSDDGPAAPERALERVGALLA